MRCVAAAQLPEESDARSQDTSSTAIVGTSGSASDRFPPLTARARTWNGIVAPVGVPRAIVTKLNAAINKVLATTTIKDRFAAIGAEPANSTPEQFGQLIRAEYVKWGDVVRRSGAKID